MSLFEELGKAHTDKQLQSIQKKYKSYDPMYIKLCVMEEKEYRNRINNMYDKAQDYLDMNFIKEFKWKDKFDARLRELYLISFLLNKNYNLVKDTTPWGPDIKIDYLWNTIRIECVTSSKGRGKNTIHDTTKWYSWPIDDIDIPRKLRLTTVVSEKLDKLNEYIKKNVIKEKDRYIIALNGWQSDWDIINNGIESILCGIWKSVYKINKGMLTWPFYEKREKIKNKNWALIWNAIFTDINYQKVSWIIYFWSSIVNCKDFDLEWISRSTTNSKIKFIKNDNTTHKIEKDFLKEIL